MFVLGILDHVFTDTITSQMPISREFFLSSLNSDFFTKLLVYRGRFRLYGYASISSAGSEANGRS